MDYQLFFKTAYIQVKAEHPEEDESALEELAHQRVHQIVNNEISFYTIECAKDPYFFTNQVQIRIGELNLIARIAVGNTARPVKQEVEHSDANPDQSL